MNRIVSKLITRSISRKVVPTKPLFRTLASKPYTTGGTDTAITNASSTTNKGFNMLPKRIRRELLNETKIISVAVPDEGRNYRHGRRNYSISVSKSAHDQNSLIDLAYRLLENGDQQSAIVFERLWESAPSDERVLYGYVLSKVNEMRGSADKLEEFVRTLTSNDALSTVRGAKTYFPSVLGLIMLRRMEFREMAGQTLTAVDENELSQAIVLFEEAVARLPEHSPLLTMLGESYIGCGRLEDAQVVLTEATRVNPLSPMPLAALAMLNLQLGRSTEAFKLLQKATKVAPASQIAWDNLAHMHHSAGHHQEATMCREKSAELGCRPTIQYGILLMKSDVDQAVGTFNLVLGLEIMKDNPVALDGLASCLYLKGQIDEALAYFEKIDGAQCARTLAEAHMTESALALLKLLHERFPHRQSQLFQAEMLVHAVNRDYAKEFEVYKKSLAISNDPCNAAKLQLLNNEVESALKTAEMSIDRSTLQGVVTIARVMLAAGKIQEAKSLLESYDAEGTNALVELLAKTELALDSDESLAKAEAYCIELQHTSAAAQILSEIYCRRGDYKQAVESWNKAWTIDNDSVEYLQAPYACPERYLLLQQRANILEAMGDIDAAVIEYTNVLAINPHDQWSKEHLVWLQNIK